MFLDQWRTHDFLSFRTDGRSSTFFESKNSLPMRFSEGVSVAGLPQCTAGLGSTLVFAVNESNVDLDRTHGADDLSGFVRVSHEQQTKPPEEEGQEVRAASICRHIHTAFMSRAGDGRQQQTDRGREKHRGIERQLLRNSKTVRGTGTLRGRGSGGAWLPPLL